jgi:hypothetical protein
MTTVWRAAPPPKPTTNKRQRKNSDSGATRDAGASGGNVDQVDSSGLGLFFQSFGEEGEERPGSGFVRPFQSLSDKFHDEPMLPVYNGDEGLKYEMEGCGPYVQNVQ